MPGNHHIPGSAKDNRQYEHIKQSELAGGRTPPEAKSIAAATVAKQRNESATSRNSAADPGSCYPGSLNHNNLNKPTKTEKFFGTTQ